MAEEVWGLDRKSYVSNQPTLGKSMILGTS